MPSKRKPGSESGKPAIDWGQAFLYYAGLSPQQRSYQAVADNFNVSVRTVERHGRNEQWKQQANDLDQAAIDAYAERVRDIRVEKLADVERLIDATHVSYANQLREGKVPVRPADLPRLHALRTELWNESDDHNDSTQTRPPADPFDPSERKLHVLQALHESGALTDLLNLAEPAATTDSGPADGGDQPSSRPAAEQTADGTGTRRAGAGAT